MIVSYILELETYKDEEGEDINLEKLICKGVYSAAYPLHNVSIQCDTCIIIIIESCTKFLRCERSWSISIIHSNNSKILKT